MPAATLPYNEIERLRALYELDVLDTPPERQLDDIARIAACLLRAPTALVSLVDQDRQWFKARYGLDATETSRDVSFCGHAVLSNDVLLVRDALDDARFADSPLVLGPPFIRFYAGAPLKTPAGLALGTLCVIDQKPRPGFSDEDVLRLRGLADLVETHFGLRLLAQQMLAGIHERQDMMARQERERARYEERLKSKREFLAKAAHEFRSPLNSVQACAAMLRSELHGPHSHPRYKNYAEIVEDAARYMESLCSGILDYAKTRSDQFALSLTPVDLCELARECADMVRAPAAQARLSVVLETAQAPLLLQGDPVRLKQCVLNLLSNAMKFTPINGEIRLTATPSGPGQVGLWIADTGVGIAPDELERAMTPFCQTSARAQSGGSGTGLGLPITKQIVERHGGTLTLTSALGKGTTAAILLPEA